MAENINVPTVIPIPEKKVRNWASAIYLSGLSGYLIPFGNLIGPFAIWLLKKEDHPFLNSQGKEVINFQLTIIAAALIFALFLFVLIIIFIVFNLFPWSIVLVPLAYLLSGFVFVIGVANLILMIIGAIKVNEGKPYVLPWKYIFIK